MMTARKRSWTKWTRLDRLGPAKEVAQIGAVIGREFSHALLASVAHKSETELQHALSIAGQQQAKSFELRAAMSLARLWRDQGKVQEALELLAPVYGWFTEGFDTRDLKDAKGLLEELAS
jgi:predicted ATPase